MASSCPECGIHTASQWRYCPMCAKILDVDDPHVHLLRKHEAQIERIYQLLAEDAGGIQNLVTRLDALEKRLAALEHPPVFVPFTQIMTYLCPSCGQTVQWGTYHDCKWTITYGTTAENTKKDE